MSLPSSDSSASAAAADCSDSKRTAWSRIESEANPMANESTAKSATKFGGSATRSATKCGGSASSSVHVAASNQMRVLNPNPSSKWIGRPHMPPPPPPPPPPSFVHQPQFIRPSPPLPPSGAVPFVGPPPPPPPPIRPFMAPPMGFPEIHSPIYYMAGPPIPPYVVAAQPVVHAIPLSAPVNAAILKQIEYYFSIDNLIKDTYLRKHMDAEGWVPAALIAGFDRVKQITHNLTHTGFGTKFRATGS